MDDIHIGTERNAFAAGVPRRTRSSSMDIRLHPYQISSRSQTRISDTPATTVESQPVSDSPQVTTSNEPIPPPISQVKAVHNSAPTKCIFKEELTPDYHNIAGVDGAIPLHTPNQIMAPPLINFAPTTKIPGPTSLFMEESHSEEDEDDSDHDSQYLLVTRRKVSKRKSAFDDHDSDYIKTTPKRRRLNDNHSSEINDGSITPHAAQSRPRKDKGRAYTKPNQRTRSKIPAKNKALPEMAKWDRQNKTDKSVDSLFRGNVLQDMHDVADLDMQVSLEEETAKIISTLRKTVMKNIPAQAREQAERDLSELVKSIQNIKTNSAIEDKIRVKGVKTPLHYHQINTLGFMRQKEKSKSGPQSGIIADHMGLGKTLTALALVANEPVSGKAGLYNGPTLIIAHPALLHQWDRQHGDHIVSREDRNQKSLGIEQPTWFKDVLQAAKNKSPSQANHFVEQKLRATDVVFTTYNKVLSSFRAHHDPKRRLTDGALHEFQWTRIILDEAHYIKDHTTLTFKACEALRTKHIWAITATPILNTTKEFYSYFRLMGHPDATSLEKFKAKFFTQKEDESGTELGKLLSQHMTRVKHDDTLFNRKLVNIPLPYPALTIHLESTPIESKIDAIVEQSIERRCTGPEDSADMATIRTKFLRQRQLASHSFVPDTFGRLLDLNDLKSIQQICSEASVEKIKVENTQYMHHILAILEESATMKDDPDLSAAYTIEQSDVIVPDMSKMHEKERIMLDGYATDQYDMQQIVQNLTKQEMMNVITSNTVCLICNEAPMDAHFTSCGHVACHPCARDLADSAANSGYAHPLCPSCSASIKFFQKCSMIAPSAKKRRNAKIQGNNGKGRKNNDSADTTHTHLPSSKVLTIKTILLYWLQQDPSVKIVVFSQFKALLKIIAEICRAASWEYRTYTGDDSASERRKSLGAFSDEEKEVRILLSTLKCGGEGLNLTCASKVLLVEPWWNHAAEQQALGRVVRIGQENRCEAIRLILKGSIEDQTMTKMKERKFNEISAAYQEHLAEIMDEENAALADELDTEDLDAQE